MEEKSNFLIPFYRVGFNRNREPSVLTLKRDW